MIRLMIWLCGAARRPANDHPVVQSREARKCATITQHIAGLGY